jgi:hypothetical protein
MGLDPSLRARQRPGLYGLAGHRMAFSKKIHLPASTLCMSAKDNHSGQSAKRYTHVLTISHAARNFLS